MSLKKAKMIAKAWASLATGNEAARALAAERAPHCMVCPHAVHKEYLENLRDKVVVLRGMVCGLCHCPLSAALRAPEKSCPDNPPRWLAKV